MARYVETNVVLTANQAAGTDPILAAETASGGGMRKAVLIGNPNAAQANLHLASGGAAGNGLPVPGNSTIAFGETLPGIDGALYVTGLAAGNTVTLWVS